MPKPVFEDVLQICAVVKNIDNAIDTWENVYGIGPWEVVHLTEKNCGERKLHGVPVHEPHHSILAMSKIGHMYLELIQPVSPNTAYAEFLERHGEGFHHIAVKHTDAFVPLMRARGIDEISSAYLGERFCAYYDTREDLGVITEIY